MATLPGGRLGTFTGAMLVMETVPLAGARFSGSKFVFNPTNWKLSTLVGKTAVPSEAKVAAREKLNSKFVSRRRRQTLPIQAVDCRNHH